MRVLYLFWGLPIIIVKSGFSVLNMVRGGGKQTTPRRRPLHTLGASSLAIAHNASVKLQNIDNPLGSIAKTSIKCFNFFFPFIYTMLYQWLSMLSFMDDQIIFVEKTVETIFPPSKHLFDKIDGLICSAEVLPEQVDGYMTKLPLIMNWSVFPQTSWLNFVVRNLTHLGSMLHISKKKDLQKDEICDGSVHSMTTEPGEMTRSLSDSSLHETENASESIKRLFSLNNIIKTVFDEQEYYGSQSPVFSSFKSAASSPFSECSFDEPTSGPMDSPTKRTYKEILERGRKWDEENKDDNAPEKAFSDEKKAEIAEKTGKYIEDGSIFKDQVEELFKASWHLM